MGSHFRRVGVQFIGRSVAESSRRGYASAFRSWCAFRGLMGCEVYLRRDESAEDTAWALIDFAAWCFEVAGNQAGTISGKFAAVQFFHRHDMQIEVDTSSPLIKCALKVS